MRHDLKEKERDGKVITDELQKVQQEGRQLRDAIMSKEALVGKQEQEIRQLEDQLAASLAKANSFQNTLENCYHDEKNLEFELRDKEN